MLSFVPSFKTKVAASHGIAGLILYPDPMDMTSDMPMTSVMTPDMTGMSGDPLTPGCPAVGQFAIGSW